MPVILPTRGFLNSRTSRTEAYCCAPLPEKTTITLSLCVVPVPKRVTALSIKASRANSDSPVTTKAPYTSSLRTHRQSESSEKPSRNLSSLSIVSVICAACSWGATSTPSASSPSRPTLRTEDPLAFDSTTWFRSNNPNCRVTPTKIQRETRKRRITPDTQRGPFDFALGRLIGHDQDHFTRRRGGAEKKQARTHFTLCVPVRLRSGRALHPGVRKQDLRVRMG